MASLLSETLYQHLQTLEEGRGCLLVTSFICMLVRQYRVVRPDTWVHLWKASSLALNLHSSSHCLSSCFQCTLFLSRVGRLRRMVSLKGCLLCINHHFD